MPCSAVTLSLATITSIIAVALLTIAFATDNWLYIDVKRANIQVRMYMSNGVIVGLLFYTCIDSILYHS